jgi:hypothetical protein
MMHDPQNVKGCKKYRVIMGLEIVFMKRLMSAYKIENNEKFRLGCDIYDSQFHL